MARDLPVLATAFYAYKLTFSEFLYAIRISWHWFALLLIAVLLPVSLFDLFHVDIPQLVQQAGFTFIIVLMFMLIYAAACASVAVLWHRHLLLGERRGGVPVQINARMLGYCWRFLLIALVLMIFAFPILFFFAASLSREVEEPEISNTVFWVFSTIAGLMLCGLFMRLAVTLPAMAIDRKGFGLVKAWRKTSGNGFYMAFAMAFTSIPFWAVDALLSEARERGFLSKSNLITDVLDLAYYLFASLVGVSLLTLSYAYLVEGREYKNLPPKRRKRQRPPSPPPPTQPPGPSTPPKAPRAGSAPIGGRQRQTPSSGPASAQAMHSWAPPQVPEEQASPAELERQGLSRAPEQGSKTDRDSNSTPSSKTTPKAPSREKPISKDDVLDVLRKGKEAWNAWRVEHGEIWPDLAFADLQGADLEGYNFQNADLEGANLEGANLDKAFMRDARLPFANLNRASVRKAILRAVNLEDATLEEADLEGADLAGANLDFADLRRARLPRTNFHWPIRDLERTSLREAKLGGADLQHANLRSACFLWADLKGADLRDAHCELTSFEGAHLADAKLDNARFRNASFSVAKGLSQGQLNTACGSDDTYVRAPLTIPICPDDDAVDEPDFSKAMVHSPTRAGVAWFEPMLEACPSFRSIWAMSMIDDERDISLFLQYLLNGELAEHLIARMDADETDGFDAIFEVIERWHAHPKDDALNEAALGILESLQNTLLRRIASRKGIAYHQAKLGLAKVEQWLPPQLLHRWQKLLDSRDIDPLALYK